MYVDYNFEHADK